jgi:hypothetical protein
MVDASTRSSSFFEGIEQVEASIAGVRGKLPTFYREARCLTAVFPARLLEMRKRLPDRRFVPAHVVPGIGAVYLAAFEYRDTDIGPYNEFAVGFLLNSPDYPRVPGYNLLRQLLHNSYHAYVRHLPVTTEVSLRGGVDLYNYPKSIASIDFSDSADRVGCELGEGEELICRLTTRKIPAPRSGIIKFFTHVYQYRQPQAAEMKVNARSFGMALGHAGVECVLGDTHPVALELQDLLITTTAMVYYYIPDMQAILYGPEHLSLVNIAAFLKSSP